MAPAPVPTILVTGPDGTPEAVAVFCPPAAEADLVPAWELFPEPSPPAAPASAGTVSSLSAADIDAMTMDDLWAHVKTTQEEMANIRKQELHNAKYASLPDVVAEYKTLRVPVDEFDPNICRFCKKRLKGGAWGIKAHIGAYNKPVTCRTLKQILQQRKVEEDKPQEQSGSPSLCRTVTFHHTVQSIPPSPIKPSTSSLQSSSPLSSTTFTGPITSRRPSPFFPPQALTGLSANVGEAAAPLNLNQWQQQAHRQPAASARPCHSGSLSNGTPTDCHSTSDFCFEPSGGLLDLLPEQYDNYDFANLDTDAIYQSLDWNLDTSVGGVLDGAVLPDMNTAASVGQDLGIGEDFLSQEPPLTNITNTLQQQPTSSPPLAPPTTTSNNKSPSIPGTSTFSLHPSPAASSSSGSSSSHKRKSSPEDESAAVALKRQRNTLAARKYRQKRLDRISELEAALAAMTSERDDMRLQLARREAEVDALREMLSKK